MNPEEGELRPQILDRFGLVVDVEAPMDPETRVEIVKRVEEFFADPDAFYRKYEPMQNELRERVKKARELLPKVEIGEDMLRLLAETIVKLGIRTNRAEIVTVRAAKAIAALSGRTRVSLEDLKKAMELALPHRLRSRPLEKPPLEKLRETLKDVSEKGRDESEHEGHHHHHHRVESGSGKGASTLRSPPATGSLEKVFKPSEAPVQLPPEVKTRIRERVERAWRGSRSEWRTVINYPHGVVVSHVPPRRVDEARDVDIVATIRAAALRGAWSAEGLRLESSDLRVRVRKTRVPRLTALVLDSSGSMAVARRISLAKRIAQELTERLYVKRDSVALIVFRGREASVVVPPTRRYVEVLEALDGVPTGGRTPLSDALYKLLVLARTVKTKNPWTHVRAILITDGKGNVPLGLAGSLREEVEALSRALAKLGVSLEIYDTRLQGAMELSRSYVDLIASVCGSRVYRVG